jgi:hypothetical protein
MSKFSRKPSPPTNKLENFIEGANVGTVHLNTIAEGLPWQNENVRDDVLKVYNLRLPEAYLLKLRYISEHIPHSMQSFCLDVLLPAIDLAVDSIQKKQ